MISLNLKKISVFSFVLLGFLTPVGLFASELKVSGWIPYWRVDGGIKSAKTNLDKLDTIHPFGFGVKEDGTLNDLAKLNERNWTKFLRTVKAEKVEVIPTIMWSSGQAIHRVLSDSVLRARHIEEIASMIKKKKFDGVDIDYEAKKAETKDFYSLFLKELKGAIGDKVLSCTTEARTPPESLYNTVPTNIEYANDYNEIAKYCDRVQIMAYDQRRADLKLNKSKNGVPYVPIADTDWVRKVLELTLKTIPKEKIMLGVATYGHEYEITVEPDWFRDYARVGALNPKHAFDTAKKAKIKPSIGKSGEMSFSYFKSTSKFKILKELGVSKDTLSGDVVAKQALLYANKTGTPVTFNYVTWSDAGAIEQKVKLAEEFGLRGIAIFKIDGEEDKKIWSLFDR